MFAALLAANNLASMPAMADAPEFDMSELQSLVRANRLELAIEAGS